MWSPVARASDPSGLIAVLAILVIEIPFVLISAFVTVRAWHGKKYADRTYAINQIIISTFFLALGVLIFLVTVLAKVRSSHIEEVLIAATLLVAPPAIFVLAPWILHLWQRTQGSNNSFKPTSES